MPHDLTSARRPTMYFIGVTTSASSINRVFPLWAERLQLGDCALRGLDFPLHANAERYREAVAFIKRDPLSLGALVTTHKIDLWNACAGQFDVVDPLTRSLGEVSSIFKRDGRLHGRAVDPWTSGHALQAFLLPDHWQGGAEVLILGAGGAGTALAWQLSRSERGAARPARIQVADRVASRLEALTRQHATWPQAPVLKTHCVADPAATARLLDRLPPRSLVVNATGVGKDTPGSPLPADAVFPQHGVVWDFNYRGELGFLVQARDQQRARKLHVEDGWTYFLHGWTSVMADIFQREIPPQGALFDELGRLAAAARG